MLCLTRENIKLHCRTCLKKIRFDDDTRQNIGLGDEITECKEFSINLAKNEEIKNLICSFMDENWINGLPEAILKDYPQYICICCYNKLQGFELFRKEVKQSTEKLQALFYYDVNKFEIGDGVMEKQGHTEPTPDTADIFNSLVKDALMETETVILVNGESTTNKETLMPDTELDLDPFDSAISSKLEVAIIDISSDTINDHGNNEMRQASSQEDEENEVLDKDVTVRAIESGSAQTIDNATSYEVFQETNKLPQMYEHSDGEDIQAIKTTTRTEQKLLRLEAEVCKLEKSNELRKNDAMHNAMKRRNKGTKNKFKCERCSHCFAHKLTLDAHVRKVHEGSKRPFHCDRCEKSYTFIGGLYTHIKEIHESEVRSHACNVLGCERIYTSFIALQKHKRLKHIDVPCVKKYVCEHCGATFNQSGNLKYHLSSKHPTEAEESDRQQPKERFECDICKKNFHSRYTLKYHTLQLHSDEMKYECNVCGRRVAKKFMLVQHMLVHSTNKMPCEHCGRQFIRKFELEAHVRAVHMKLKPFECQYCNECFATKKTLRHHEYIHTGEKPYVCDICGQAYRQQTCLKNHRKSHERSNCVLTSNIGRTNSYLMAVPAAPTFAQTSK